MKLIEVKSSNVKKIGYESNNLYVEFAAGVYEYQNVDRKVFEELLAAESKGKYLIANVYSKYNYKKLFEKVNKKHLQNN